jgi:hypothetical protein
LLQQTLQKKWKTDEGEKTLCQQFKQGLQLLAGRNFRQFHRLSAVLRPFRSTRSAKQSIPPDSAANDDVFDVVVDIPEDAGL